MGQIVFLDAEDDIASVRARLDAVRDQSAAVVVPRDNLELRNSITMRLLARHAERRALDLVVISEEGLVRRHAQQEGLLAFRSLESYREYDRAHDRRRFSLDMFFTAWRRLVGTFMGLALVVGVAGGLAGTAYTFVPSARVELVPATLPVAESFQFAADASLVDIDYVERRIPARSISLLIEAYDQTPASGQRDTSGGRAEGQVTFRNRTGEVVKIAPGTTVSTAEGARFITLGELILPAGEGSTGRVGITAVEPGESGNVARLQINRVEGKLSNSVVVLNEEATRGGGVARLTVVSSDDHRQLRDRLLDRVRREARAQLVAQLQEDELLPDPSVTVIVLGEEFDHKVGEEARTVGLRLRARASGLTYRQEHVDALIRRSWYPALRPGFYVDYSTLEVLSTNVVEARGSIVVLEAPLKATAVAAIDRDRVADEVRWKTVEEAEAILFSMLELGRPPVVQIEPGWAARAMRVQIVIGDATSSAQPSSN